MESEYVTLAPSNFTDLYSYVNYDADSNVSAGNSNSCVVPPNAKDSLYVQVVLAIVYGTVFVTAVFGNALVVYVVVTNRNMQTPTNLFISNLAFSDIVVNLTSVWVTPLYIYIGSWVFGGPSCYIVSLFQGTSIFISTLTLTAIALDRYIAIIHPLKPRLSLSVCIIIIVSIWLCSLMLIAPYVMNMRYEYFEDCKYYACYEHWNVQELRHVYGIVVLVLQYGVPIAIIAYCYIRISIRLWKPTGRMIGSRSAEREAHDLARKRRLVKMLMSMVGIFTICWLPINITNIIRDNHPESYRSFYFTLIFLVTHLIAVTATCWNPILYGFMNENFRREFVAVLPCFLTGKRLDRNNTSGRRRPARPSRTGGGGSIYEYMSTTSEYPYTEGAFDQPSTATQTTKLRHNSAITTNGEACHLLKAPSRNGLKLSTSTSLNVPSGLTSSASGSLSDFTLATLSLAANESCSNGDLKLEEEGLEENTLEEGLEEEKSVLVVQTNEINL